ncbi:MAG: hypothetical protein S0880_36870 [Actinomycetota bacterium]|nr:hypothetical protein [Actinomycetota bacterium]
MKTTRRGRSLKSVYCSLLVVAAAACGGGTESNEEPLSALATAADSTSTTAAPPGEDVAADEPVDTVDGPEELNAASGLVTWGADQFSLTGSQHFLQCEFTEGSGDVVVDVRLSGVGTIELSDRRTLPPSLILDRDGERSITEDLEVQQNPVATSLSGTGILENRELSFTIDC